MASAAPVGAFLGETTVDQTKTPTQAKTSLLIVEDDEGIRSQLRWALAGDYDVHLATNGQEGLEAFARAQPGVVTLDLGLPPHPDGAQEGLRVLAGVLSLAPTTKVIVLTGNTDKANALKAIRLGAFDYYLKPVEIEEFRTTVRRAAYLHGLERDARVAASGDGGPYEGIIGGCAAMREVLGTIDRVAGTNATVLIQGESGTGKELVARAIHARSARKDRAFVPINCGAIPETLLESELFGHEKGAFTGAHVQRTGRLETADGGTVFLDEIGEMSLGLQVKLLRFLQDHQIERVGGRLLIRLDVRVIAATNSDLPQAMTAGAFREDLFYRLSVVSIALPPLRERQEDVLLLALTFLDRYRAECQRPRLRGFAPDAEEAIKNYAWPGNVRELDNKVKRAVIMASGHTLTAEDLGLAGVTRGTEGSLKAERERVERVLAIEALKRTQGNVSQAARDLGISRPTLNSLLARMAVDARDFKKRKAAESD